MASAAGGPAAPIAPGEIIAIYRQQNVDEPELFGQLDEAGSMPAILGDTQVFFDGVAARSCMSRLFR